jgi:hypothetical protein
MLTTDLSGAVTLLPIGDSDEGKKRAIAAAELAFSLGRKSPCLRSVPKEYKAFCVECFNSLRG